VPNPKTVVERNAWPGRSMVDGECRFPCTRVHGVCHRCGCRNRCHAWRMCALSRAKRVTGSVRFSPGSCLRARYPARH